jgi:predicted amidophosphoribosyltransferase
MVYIPHIEQVIFYYNANHLQCPRCKATLVKPVMLTRDCLLPNDFIHKTICKRCVKPMEVFVRNLAIENLLHD